MKRKPFGLSFAMTMVALSVPALALLVPATWAEQDEPTLIEQARTLKQEKKYDQAAQVLREALKSASNNAEAHSVLAWVLVAQGERADALKHFREVVRLAPNSEAGKQAAAALKRMASSAPKRATRKPPRPAASSPIRRESFVLVDSGKAQCPIYVTRSHHSVAKWLVEHLKRISGAEFEIKIAEEEPEESSIVLGAFSRDDVTELPGDSFVIRTEGAEGNRRLVLAGPTLKATGFAAFAFLEEVLGCKWWSYTEEELPSLPTVSVGRLDLVRKAAFQQPYLYNNEARTGANAFLYKSRGMPTEQFTGGHTLYPLLTPYAKTHPDIYPFSKKTGKRAHNNLHFCYTAPGIVDALTEALEKEVKRYKGNVRDFIYFAGMGDWYGGMCECERCEPIYARETWTNPEGTKRTGYSATLLQMINAVAEALEKKHPGIRVGTFAYMSLQAPPALTRPRQNVVVQVPHLRHCIIHRVDKCPKNRLYLLDLKRWCELAPGRVYVWDYAANFGENFMYPFPVLHSIAENIRLYGRMGVAGVLLQGNYVSPGGDLAVLKNHVWGRLLWDPQLEVQDLVTEFCQGYYGPAAQAVQRYVNELESAVGTNATVHMDEFAKRDAIQQNLLTDDRVGKLRQFLAAARQAAAGKEPYARRVEEVAASLEAFDLYHFGPLAERDGRLVRADLDHQYTFPRAENLIKHSRGAAPREWGSGRAYQDYFLSMHGGPLVTLSAGDTQVKAAPALALRLWQVVYKGAELLRLSGFDPQKRWFGGAVEELSSHAHFGKVSGESSAAKARMEGLCGIRNWSANTKQRVRKVVEVLEDDTIRVTLASIQVDRKAEHSQVNCSARTEYAVGEGQAPPRVELMTADGTWADAKLQVPAVPPKRDPRGPTPKAPQTTLPAGAKALRIHLASKGCIVEDRYLEPTVTGGQAWFDEKGGFLTTVVATDSAQLNTKTETQWFTREIRLAPGG